jgi:hypothetical protein
VGADRVAEAVLTTEITLEDDETWDEEGKELVGAVGVADEVEVRTDADDAWDRVDDTPVEEASPDEACTDDAGRVDWDAVDVTEVDFDVADALSSTILATSHEVNWCTHEAVTMPVLLALVKETASLPPATVDETPVTIGVRVDEMSEADAMDDASLAAADESSKWCELAVTFGEKVSVGITIHPSVRVAFGRAVELTRDPVALVDTVAHHSEAVVV